MKILIVDQFGKTTCADTMAIAEALYNIKHDEITVYLSDNSEIPEREHHLKIEYGFHKAYEGNIISKVFHYLKSVRLLRKHIKNNHYDIVNLQWFSIPWLEKRFIRKIKKNSKVVITVHDVIPFDNHFNKQGVLDKIYQLADMLLIHTETAKDEFKKHYKAKTPIKVISPGFCNKKDYVKIDKFEARKHLALPNDAIIYLFYGTIRPSKGLDMLIEAFTAACEKSENIYLLCAGAAHEADKKRYQELSKHLANSKLGSFNFNFVPREEEKFYFSASDVLCLPYTMLTQSGVAALGLVYDLPIIGTDVGSMREVVKDGVNGIVVKKDDALGFTNAILKLEDVKLREEYSKKSKQLSETDFSLDKKAGLMMEAYDFLMG